MRVRASLRLGSAPDWRQKVAPVVPRAALRRCYQRASHPPAAWEAVGCEAVLTGGERVARGRLAPGAHDHLEAIALLMFVIIVAQPSAGASAPLTMLASVWPQKFHTEPIAGIAGARAPDSATFEKSLMS